MAAGRPKLDFDIDYMEELLFELRLPLSKVAQIFGVSRPTIYSRLREEGINMSEIRFINISDEDLQTEVHQIKLSQPNAGLSYLIGHLRAKKIFVPRRRILEQLRVVDPDGVEDRKRGVTERRIYSVPCPNFMWHLDGHHKLINWKFVIHACIDGFSRLVMFLQCSDNNRSSTVEELFGKATQQYGYPLRVRTDYGGENVGVWQAMENHRGVGKKPFIAGSSVHNSRVERLHRDVKQQVVEPFKDIFLQMESRRMLDRENPTDLFCLHFIFLPRINRALQQFQDGHNHHPLRTEKNASPKQLYHLNIDNFQQHQTFDETEEQPGLTADQLLECDLPFVPVKPARCPLRRHQLEDLKKTIDPMADIDPVDLFVQTTEFVINCLQNAHE